MASSSSSTKILIIIIAVAVLISGGYAFTKLFAAPSASIFPDTVYLESPSSLNGEVTFKARVVSQLGRSNQGNSIRFTVLETQSGELLDLVVVLPDAVMPSQLLPGQIFKVVAQADQGNMLATELLKF